MTLEQYLELPNTLPTERMRRFVYHYATNGQKASRAAKAAGYGSSYRANAQALLHRADIVEALLAFSIRYGPLDLRTKMLSKIAQDPSDKRRLHACKALLGLKFRKRPRWLRI